MATPTTHPVMFALIMRSSRLRKFMARVISVAWVVCSPISRNVKEKTTNSGPSSGWPYKAARGPDAAMLTTVARPPRPGADPEDRPAMLLPDGLRWMRAVPTRDRRRPTLARPAPAPPRPAEVRGREEAGEEDPTTTRETCIVIAEAAFQPTPPMIRRPRARGRSLATAASGSIGRRFGGLRGGLSRGG